MKFTRFLFFVFVFALVGAAISIYSNADLSKAAFGTSPPWVRNDHLLPGATFTEIIYLSRSDTNSDVKVSAEITGEKNLLKWIEIENEDELILRKGEKAIPMNVVIEVPKRAALKEYRGDIFVTLDALQDKGTRQGGSVAIKLGAHISVELTVVGEKVTDYRVKSATLDTLQEGDSFHINLEVENLGNTEIANLNGQVDIYDKKEAEILKTLTFERLDTVISPDDIVKSRVGFENIVLDPGEYWVVIKIFKGDQVIYENRLHQQINKKVVSVVMAEDALATSPKKPSLPTKEDEEAVKKLSAEEILDAAVIGKETVREAAPAVTENNIIILFGLIGLGFGLLALIAVIVVLVVLLKRQHEATIQQYLAQSNFKGHGQE